MIIRRHTFFGYRLNITPVEHDLVIFGESQYTGKNFILTAKYDDKTVYPTWTIIAGSQYATVNSNGNGKINITTGAQNNPITVQASYTDSLGVTTTETKVIYVTYDNELAIEGSPTITGILLLLSGLSHQEINMQQ